MCLGFTTCSETPVGSSVASGVNQVGIHVISQNVVTFFATRTADSPLIKGPTTQFLCCSSHAVD